MWAFSLELIVLPSVLPFPRQCAQPWKTEVERVCFREEIEAHSLILFPLHILSQFVTRIFTLFMVSFKDKIFFSIYDVESVSFSLMTFGSGALNEKSFSTLTKAGHNF